jgi:hypothetical protein
METFDSKGQYVDGGDGKFVLKSDHLATLEAAGAELETEKDHSRFLEDLLKALYGDGWGLLTIYEAKKRNEQIAALTAINTELREYKTADEKRKGDLFAKKVFECERLTAENERLREALKIIRKYGCHSDGTFTGICDYGCDTPQVANDALKEAKDGQE